MKKLIVLNLLICSLGVLVFAQQNYDPNSPDYIPPLVELDIDFYLAEGVPLTTILEVAWSKRSLGYTQGALAYYQYAVERYPSSYEAHTTQASYYHELGQLEHARAAYQRAFEVATNPQQQSDARYFVERVGKELLWGAGAVGNFERAYYKYSQGDYTGSAADFLSITNSNPQWLEAHYWLGRSYLELGQHQEARNNLNKVVQSADVNSEIYKGAAWLLTTF